MTGASTTFGDEPIKLSKSEYVLDYVRLGMCVYTCVALCFPSVMLAYFT